VRGQAPVRTRSGTSDSLTKERFHQCRQTFSHRQDVDGQERIVDRLHGVAGSNRPHVLDALSERLQHRAGSLEGARIGSHHYGKRSRLGPVGPAAHRRIRERNVLLGQPLSDPPGAGGITRGTVEQHGSAPETREQSVGPIQQSLDLTGVGRQVTTTSAPSAACLGVSAIRAE